MENPEDRFSNVDAHIIARDKSDIYFYCSQSTVKPV